MRADDAGLGPLLMWAGGLFSGEERFGVMIA